MPFNPGLTSSNISIGSVQIEDSSGNVIDPSSEGTTPYIYNESMASSSTVYNKALPANTKQLTIKLRDIGADLKISWVAGFSTYMTIMAGASKTLTGVNLTGETLYFQATDNSQVAEIEVITQ